MRDTRRAVVAVVAVAVLAGGCATGRYRVHEQRDEARLIRPPVGAAAGAPIAWRGSGRLWLELRRLEGFSAELGDVSREIDAINRWAGGKPPEAFTPDEHDTIESLLFRYLVCREALWDVAACYGQSQSLFTGREDETRGFIVAYDAALLLTYTDAKLVSTFLEHPAVVAKLNEAYPAVRIPGGTFDRLMRMVMDVEHLEAMEAAWALFQEQLDDPRSPLNRVAASDERYGRLVADIRRQRLYSKAQTDRLLDRRAVLFPEAENRLRQSRVAELGAEAAGTLGDGLRAGGSLLGRGALQLTKAVFGQGVAFSGEQVEALYRAARPGDIVLVMTEGYLSNIFIPGAFKHGLTYVGTPLQRRTAGLSREAVTLVDRAYQKPLADNMFRSRDEEGEEADTIEAVSEGVVFTSLRELVGKHPDRLLILRPRLEGADRAYQLATCFGRLGGSYDYGFDFVDDRRLCCTELIYRSLNGRGPFSFRLVKRMGRYTLSADDIIRTHFEALEREAPLFEFVALAEADPARGGEAGRVLTGEAGAARLRDLMGVPPPDEAAESADAAPAPRSPS